MLYYIPAAQRCLDYIQDGCLGHCVSLQHLARAFTSLMAMPRERAREFVGERVQRKDGVLAPCVQLSFHASGDELKGVLDPEPFPICSESIFIQARWVAVVAVLPFFEEFWQGCCWCAQKFLHLLPNLVPFFSGTVGHELIKGISACVGETFARVWDIHLGSCVAV